MRRDRWKEVRNLSVYGCAPYVYYTAVRSMWPYKPTILFM